MLVLRAFHQQDKSLLEQYLNQPQVTRFLSSRIPQPYGASDAQWWIDEGARQGIIRAITLDDMLVGCVGAEPGQYEYAKNAELGYWLAAEHWGKGFATQAVSLLLEELVSKTDLARLNATVFEGNKASERVLIKNGFAQQGFLPKAVYKNDTFFNACLYGKLIR